MMQWQRPSGEEAEATGGQDGLLMTGTGFEEVKADTDLTGIRKAWEVSPFMQNGLASTLRHRFAVSGRELG
jgi:hypothetical protein